MQTQLSIVINKLICIILVFSFSCNQETEKAEKETYAIISFLIGALARPIPPPPPSGLSDLEFKKKSDSIKKTILNKQWMEQEFIISVDSVMKTVENSLNNPFNHNTSQLFSGLKACKTNFNLTMSKVKIPTNIKVLDATPLNSLGKIDWSGTSMYLSFSRISFNSTYTKAMLIVNVSRGKLNGYSELFLLENLKNKWFIKESHLLEIS